MKIDTSKIPNFDALPDEAKEAIQGMEFADAPDMSLFVAKTAFDKKASEAASWKKKHDDLLSEDERAKQEQSDKLTSMEQELATLRKEKTVSEYTAKFAGMGYDEVLAKETAMAMADGDMAKVFANQTKFNEGYAKKVVAEKLKGTPRGGAGAAGTDPVADYDKLIEKANESGNIAEAAYYYRLREQAKSNQ